MEHTATKATRTVQNNEFYFNPATAAMSLSNIQSVSYAGIKRFFRPHPHKYGGARIPPSIPDCAAEKHLPRVSSYFFAPTSNTPS